jgi:hypothetical protein
MKSTFIVQTELHTDNCHFTKCIDFYLIFVEILDQISSCTKIQDVGIKFYRN